MTVWLADGGIGTSAMPFIQLFAPTLRMDVAVYGPAPLAGMRYTTFAVAVPAVKYTANTPVSYCAVRPYAALVVHTLSLAVAGS